MATGHLKNPALRRFLLYGLTLTAKPAENKDEW
jgi:hypothetical protein